MIIELLLYHSVVALVESSLIVTTSSGPVLGKLVENDEGVSYYAYQGIPYAESPTGKLRFKPPVPIKPWMTIYNATSEGPICPQRGSYTNDEMNEDCLRVNIYVPSLKTEEHLSVYFYIHGGAFKSGSGNSVDVQGPQLFLKKDIIYVSVNYRLGALGFLSLNQEEAQGNAGLKDVLLALKWINNNIERFGGKGITIGGQSAGAAIVHYLLLTDHSSGLFQHAVLNSGSATNFRYLSRQPLQTARSLAEQLGLATDNDDAMLQGLLHLDVSSIVEAQEKIYKEKRNIMRPFAPFVPCIENESPHAILTKNPYEIIESGIPQNVPILAGITSQEGGYMYTTLREKSLSFLEENFMLCLPSDIEYPVKSQMYKDLRESIIKTYVGSNSTNWTLVDFYNLLSDTQYSSSVDYWIRIHIQRNECKPLYYYVFDFDGEYNWAKLKYNLIIPGMVHADDLGYMFLTEVTKSKIKEGHYSSLKTMEYTLMFLTNFIKYGNPTPQGYESPLTWPKCDKDRPHLVLKDEPESRPYAPFQLRFDFWFDVYTQYKKYLKSGGVDHNGK